MKPRIIRPKDHAEWLAEREKGIGASDVAAILGLSPFETAYTLWLKKTHRTQPEAESVAMKMGHMLEPIVATLWEEATGEKVVKASAADIIYVHPEYDFMRATPDRVVRGKKKILECKTTVTQIDENEPPIHWITQVTYQMYVTGIHDADLAWLVSGRYFGFVHVDYDEEYAEFIAKRVAEFWNDSVIGDSEPELISVEDFAIHGSEPRTQVEADDKCLGEILWLKDIKAEISDREKQVDKLSDSIKLFMGEKESLTHNGHTLATWKTTAKSRTFRLSNAGIQEQLNENNNNNTWQ